MGRDNNRQDKTIYETMTARNGLDSAVAKNAQGRQEVGTRNADGQSVA
jgi:hypothetical protein